MDDDLDPELEALNERYVEAKHALTAWLHEHERDAFRETLERQMRRRSSHLVTDAIIAEVNEALLFESNVDCVRRIEAFLEQDDALDEEQRGWIASWRDTAYGLFVLGERDGRVVEAENLVDGLPYRAIVSSDDPAALSMMRRGLVVASRVLPLSGGLHAWSGAQHTYPPQVRPQMLGIAAQFATKNPRHYYRNPAHLERVQRRLAVSHEVFVELFGRPWLWGSPREVAAAVEQLLRADAERTGAPPRAMAPFTRELLACSELGLFTSPLTGLHISPIVRPFVEALREPEKRGAEHPELVVAALEEPHVTPDWFHGVGDDVPEVASITMREVTGRADFEWQRDLDAVLREYKPLAYLRPLFPPATMLDDAMAEALAALERELAQPRAPRMAPRVQSSRRPPPTKRRKKKKR